MLATGGDTHLGGDDFDERIVEWAVAEFRRSDRIDLTKDPAAMGRLKEEAEKAKKELSSALSAQLNLPFIAVGKDGPHHLDLSLGRPQFEMMTGDLLARTVQPVSYTHLDVYKRQTVEFLDVSFRYPGSEQYALRHLSMTFKVCLLYT